ncbi:ABC transporter ATP-binding protein [Rhodoferax koreense]|uniref:ABC transporter ATP-binding protein n=1 Tax=Rhodoferax koreensis TaxID=1842727 RepID=A0A1P8JT45_9BURK|nr:ABC transporter ATP-binding protein/permease [Rhodoferax koreense]APW36891.1 ABC transporter ATP-binding protein [Rhodoferax koreense]
MSLSSRTSLFRRQMGKVWKLSAPYFQSEDKWKARAMLAGIVALNLAGVYLLVLYNDWYRLFYDALENKNQPVFWTQLGRFTYIAFAMIILAVYKFYLTQLLEIRWRAWMTGHYLERWLANHAFYHLELARFAEPDAGQHVPTSPTNATPDNPDQRIQEDLNLFTTYTISLTMGLLNAVVTLVSFVGILWGLSGGFAFSFNGSQYNIPGFMVWMAVLYCLAGSVITHYIGRPQIALNFQQQRYEADFRHHMVRVREYSESIALDKGEAVERKQLDLRFSSVLANYLTLLKAQKRLIWFNSFFGQAAVVFPFIVAAPRFFSGAIQLGTLMQISSAFGRVQDSLSWFVDNYSNLAAWRATADRLTSFEDSIRAREQAQAMSGTINEVVEAASGELQTQGLQLALPGGAVLLDGLGLRAAPGDSVLLKGPSGSGKSTLFRALAGIWPYARGRVALPANSMFIPQRPYFPDGTLRDALAYPRPASEYSDEALRQALADALLPQLTARLDDADAWSQKLSGGEQQRLAVARVLLKKPRWIFADEATSALDEEAEGQVYQRLLAQVQRAQGALVSIAHRPAVARFHRQQWLLEKEPEGAAARFRLAQKSLEEPA